MKALTVRELYDHLAELYRTTDGFSGNSGMMEVLLRIQSEEGELLIGGLTSLDVEASSIDTDALIMDGMTEAGMEFGDD